MLRKMLGFAIRRQFGPLKDLIESEGADIFTAALGLCVPACGYIAVHVSGRWPGKADLREIAGHAARSVTGFEVSEDEIYAFLSRAVFGPEPIDEAVPDPQRFGVVTLFATAAILLSFCPGELEWFEYLDQIWNATEEVSRTRAESPYSPRPSG